ncbi:MULTISPECIES: DotU family type IV/VI secretion system protein [unclassified Agarivorans]|uniref:DotU family type IV/VI secretion system protein n=1 Tax=unclassified Agarivorans TaxID=2636026 RepID=UPI003D7CA8B1
MKTKTDQLDLLSLMVQFYELIAIFKQQNQQGILDDVVKREIALAEAPKPEEIAYAVQARLRLWLEATRHQYNERNTARENQSMKCALYAMVALADELALFEIDWVGQAHWQDILLEKSMFKSCRAGSTMFELIEKLLNARSHTSMERQLSTVYLFMLRLGFAGRYREQPEKLASYRQRLYRLLRAEANGQSTPICATAYKHLLVSNEQQRLAPIANWYRKMAWVTLTYLVLSSAIWALLNLPLSQLSLLGLGS